MAYCSKKKLVLIPTAVTNRNEIVTVRNEIVTIRNGIAVDFFDLKNLFIFIF